MKSRRGTLKVLLDTSFLLPTLGINTGEAVLEGLRLLNTLSAEIYYSRFSILEALWLAARYTKSATFNMERFTRGLRSLSKNIRYHKVDEDSGIFEEALKLNILGHRDMIDNILYATSVYLGLTLLTFDKELKRFVQEKRLKDTLTLPSQLASTP